MFQKKKLSYIILSILALLLSCTGLFIGVNFTAQPNEIKVADAYSSYTDLYYSYPDYSYDYDGSTLPAQYCMRDEYMLYAKQQASQGLCWAFGSQTALSTTIMKATGQWLDFSESWISLALTYGLNYDDFPDYENALDTEFLPGGGQYYCSVDLIAKKYGLVLEQDFPFEDSGFLTKENTPDYFEFYSRYANKNIMDNIKGGRFALYNQQSGTTKTKTFNSMKQHIIKYGAVEAGMFWNDYVETTYNGKTIAYKIPKAGSGYGGHLVTLIGWDDSISIAYNGTTYTGAWIALNSWGDDHGYDGLTYLFYDDTDYNSAFFGWKYTENTTESTYLITSINEVSNGDYTTDKVGAYYGDFSAEEGQTLQQNIFYNIDDINLIYDYKISANTNIASIEVIKQDGKNVTDDFEITTTSTQIKLTANDVPVGAYKIITTCQNTSTSAEEEFINAFYVTDGMEMGYAYLDVSCSSKGVSTKGRFQNFNSLYTSSKDFYFADTATSGYILVIYQMGSYSDVQDIQASSGITVNVDPNGIQYFHISYNFSSTNINKRTLTFINSQNKTQVMNFYIQKATSTDMYPYVMFETNGGTLNGDEAKRMVVSGDGALVPTPTKEGYTFKGWYYSDEFTSNNKLTNKNGGYYIEQSKIIKYSSSTVDWQSAFNTWYGNSQVVFLHADWEVAKYTISASAQGGGTISPSGEVEVEHGKSQTFTFSANAGNAITAIYVDDQPLTGTSLTNAIANGYTFENVTENHTISVVFTANSFTITATSNGNGTISPNGYVPVNEGSNKTFTFTPETGYYLSELAVDGVALDAIALTNAITNGYTFTNITKDHTIEATFTIQTFTITASKTGNGYISPAGTTTRDYGGKVKYTFTAEEGYQISQILIDGTALTGTALTNAIANGYTFENVTENHTISVVFTANSFTITATSNGNGTISPNGYVPVNEGSNKTFTFTPETGYYLSELEVDGVALDATALTNAITNGYTFTNITQDHTIEATFAIQTFTITASKTGNGYISPAGTTTRDYGGKVKYTFTAEEGYQISQILIDGIALTGTDLENAIANGYTFENITQNHTISVEFTKIYFTITITHNEGGSVSPDGNISVGYGESKIITITPNSGYMIAKLIVDGVEVVPTNRVTFSNITSNKTLAVVFDIIKYAINSSKVGNGSISPEGNVMVAQGQSQTFTFWVDEGWHIASILVDGIALSPEEMADAFANGYTFTNVQGIHSIKAVYEIDAFTISVTATGFGSVSPAGEQIVEWSSNKTFTFMPNEGYKIKEIIVDGQNKGAISSYTFTNVKENHTIEAVFERIYFTLTIESNEGGQISPNGEIQIGYGDSQTITITPNASFKIESIKLDGVEIEIKNTITLTDVKKDYRLQVKFIEIFTITSSIMGEGSATPTTEVLQGGQFRVEFTPQIGYKIKDVQIDGISIGAVDFYIFMDINSSHTIVAEFAIQTFNISLNIDGKGEVNCSASLVDVEYGSDRTFTITPNKGWKVYKVYVNGNSQTIKNNTLTLSTITENASLQVIFEKEEGKGGVDGTMIAIIIAGVVIATLLVVLIVKKGKKPPKSGEKVEKPVKIKENVAEKRQPKPKKELAEQKQVEVEKQKPAQAKDQQTPQQPQVQTQPKQVEVKAQPQPQTRPIPPKPPLQPQKPIPTRPIPPRPPIPPKPPIRQGGAVNQKALERAQAFKKNNGENK
ncbi:MAG: InlB B-repeat-containing protein [Clostridia bacterium]|nr:InlB B-repeat-containing protein [Clostridia bacterium]